MQPTHRQSLQISVRIPFFKPVTLCSAIETGNKSVQWYYLAVLSTQFMASPQTAMHYSNANSALGEKNKGKTQYYSKLATLTRIIDCIHRALFSAFSLIIVIVSYMCI